MIESKYIERIVEELELSPTQVTQTIELLDSGATIPFLARYRKDLTDNLNEAQLDAIADRNIYFTALTDRRNFILTSLATEGELTDELRAEIERCVDRVALEDLFLPFKKKRRSKAGLAREKGLEPLADFLWAQELADTPIEAVASRFLENENTVVSAEEALDGACDILAERLSFHREVRQLIRNRFLQEGRLTARPTKNAEGKKTKYENYYGFSEPVRSVPWHRFFTILRGVKEGVLRMELKIDDEHTAAELLKQHLKVPGSPFEPYLKRVIHEAYEYSLRPTIENEVINLLHSQADDEAIRVVRENVENILMAPVGGETPVIGVNPDSRGECCLAAVDKGGTFLEGATVSLTGPPETLEDAKKVLLGLMDKYGIAAIAIPSGSGPGAREAAAFARNALHHDGQAKGFFVFVNDAGLAAYASSRIACEEFPDFAVPARRAISVARRFQDPLAELAKVDPRYLAVGQYQHEVNPKRLRDGLVRTLVSCASRVGADLNRASTALLRYVSGLQPQTAANLVAMRQKLGRFSSREQLLEVPGIGSKVFEQCAGFLHVVNGANALDSTRIHPEAYPVVGRIADMVGAAVGELLGNAKVLVGMDLSQFQTETVGPLALEDIRKELMGARRDPRAGFRVPRFAEGLRTVEHVKDGMVIEGIVTNVTDFGAFVDIGVNQDGLVHLSEMANRYIRDPHSIAKVGDVVRVRVLKVEKEPPRISLSMKGAVERRAQRPHKKRRVPRPIPAADSAAQSERTDSADSGEAARPRNARPRRPARKSPPSKRPPKQAGRTRLRAVGSTEPLNTQLAEQLAPLREKFS